MNVGIIISHTADGMEEKIAAAVKQGFHHCQITSWLPELWTEKNAAKLKKACDKNGMEITAFWVGWSGPHCFWNFTEGPQTMGIVPPAYRSQRIEDLLNGAAFARLLGVRDVVSHMGFIPENACDVDYPGVRAAVKYLALNLKDHGQNFMFETGQETPVTLLRLIQDVGTDNLFVNLDPANLILYGKGNPIDALDVFGPYVRGVHVKDGFYPTDGYALGREVKVGEGKVNFPVLLKHLKEVGYDGSLTIEREISGEQQRNDIEETQVYIQNLIDAL